ncbi:MAG TPA: CocE/NonD family hydrolase [Candidatus Dormibacteraeota bacterium]|nr:CocE/NonD family hydrolase [Candidatus Dormibacteraeota bacterium]
MRRHIWVLAALALIAAAAGAQEQKAALPDLPKLFEKREVMIPTRDGVKLHTEIYTPKDAKEPLPIIMMRTPYGISAGGNGYSRMLYENADMFADGYIFVFQDIRGRYGSEGKFEMNRPLHDPKDAKGTDESTDTYDTIDWLVKNLANNNGRVGIWGVSYDGFLAAEAMVNPHPALKAVSEQACMGDAWMGDDFFHNGAFRLSYGFEYAELMEAPKANLSFAFDRFDMFDWFLRLGALSNANERYLHWKIPTWNNFVAHPAYDEFWKIHAIEAGLKDAKVPNLNVAGWWDQEDFYGPMRTYANLEKSDTKHLNYLVVGPWNHGGWSGGPGNSLGEIPFGSDTGVYFRQKVEAPWFAYWLHDKGRLPLKEAVLFQTGSDTWTSFDAWPPREAETKSLYFGENGKLSFEAPMTESQKAFDAYESDPAHPVPYRHRPVDATYPADHPGSWYTWLVQDQRFVNDRPDVATWQTDELQEDVTLAGQVTAKLYASTTGTDSDWVVKLIDVYPQKVESDWKLSGYELMIADEIFRGRYRKSYEEPEPIVAGEVTPYTIDLHTADHVFLKGHRIMVQVQSTWFPLYDRNPQKFVGNIFEAKEADYQKATQRVYRSREYPSRVEISVVPEKQKSEAGN